MENEFLANLKQEGSDPFAELESMETETPATSPVEEKPEADKPTEGEETTKEPVVSTQEDEDEPFHRRWKVREEKLKAELDQSFKQELEKYKQELEQKYSPTGKAPAPQFLTDMVGENEQVAKNFQQYEQQLKESVKREIFEEAERARVQAQQEEQKWSKWVDDEVKTLQDEGHTFDRNELLKTVLDYRPTDEKNNYDFRAALKILEATRVKPDQIKTEARKVLADTTIKSSQGESGPKDYMTSNDIRNKSWNQL